MKRKPSINPTSPAKCQCGHVATSKFAVKRHAQVCRGPKS